MNPEGKEEIENLNLKNLPLTVAKSYLHARFFTDPDTPPLNLALGQVY